MAIRIDQHTLGPSTHQAINIVQLQWLADSVQDAMLFEAYVLLSQNYRLGEGRLVANAQSIIWTKRNLAESHYLPYGSRTPRMLDDEVLYPGLFEMVICTPEFFEAITGITISRRINQHTVTHRRPRVLGPSCPLRTALQPLIEQCGGVAGLYRHALGVSARTSGAMPDAMPDVQHLLDAEDRRPGVEFNERDVGPRPVVAHWTAQPGTGDAGGHYHTLVDFNPNTHETGGDTIRVRPLHQSRPPVDLIHIERLCWQYAVLRVKHRGLVVADVVVHNPQMSLDVGVNNVPLEASDLTLEAVVMGHTIPLELRYVGGWHVTVPAQYTDKAVIEVFGIEGRAPEMLVEGRDFHFLADTIQTYRPIPAGTRVVVHEPGKYPRAPVKNELVYVAGAPDDAPALGGSRVANTGIPVPLEVEVPATRYIEVDLPQT